MAVLNQPELDCVFQESPKSAGGRIAISEAKNLRCIDRDGFWQKSKPDPVSPDSGSM
jgi:hypothetical protein